jgi:VIT1/CCC1 family predicted Fe2+/Mn2+ transporter
VKATGDNRPDSPLEAGVLGGGNLRAAVLGVNDGLVSNLSLVMGVAGGVDDPKFVLLAGIAGLIAGAFSMAAGEYISVRSQRDVYRHQIRRESSRLNDSPEYGIALLERIYKMKGLTADEASEVARRIMLDPDVALDTIVREDLGLSPSSMGSPFGAASSSFVAFVLGAIVPVLPYLFDAGPMAFTLSAFLSAVALAGIGAVVASGSGLNAAWGAVRMLAVGGLAAAVTYGIGRLIGVHGIGLTLS